jgi:hypothetical protein
VGSGTFVGGLATVNGSVTIADGSVVEGDIIVRDPKRKVTVFLTNGGTVKGEVVNAEVVDRPSN